MTPDDGSTSPATDPSTSPVRPDAPVVGAADEATHGIDDVLGREVALVTLRPVSGAALEMRVDRIRRLARLHHPHLVEVYDVDGLDDDAEHVLVLESVGGRPLDEIAADAPLPLARVAEIGARVASALAQAHRHGVVHGRLGAASVLVEDDQRVWLVGLTASLQDAADRPPDAATDATDAVGADTVTAVTAGPPTRAGDLRALAATLAAVVVPPDAVELERVLGDARHGGGSADELSGRLIRLARRESGPTDHTGAAQAPPAGGAGSGGMRRLSARALVGAGAVTAGAAASGAAATPGAAGPGNGAAGDGGAGAVTPGTDRRSWGLLGGARLATLVAVALVLVLTSGVVIWGQETRGWFGAAQAEPEAAVPAPSSAPLQPPLPVTAPGSPSGSRSSGSRSSGSESSGSDSDRTSRATDADRSPATASSRGPVLPPVPATTAPRTPVAPTQPPVTQPPVTEPPVTEPPVTQPPVTQPPTSKPTKEPGTPSGDPPTPSSGGGADPGTKSGSSAGSNGADGASGTSSAAPRTRTAEPDVGAEA